MAVEVIVMTAEEVIKLFRSLNNTEKIKFLKYMYDFHFNIHQKPRELEDDDDDEMPMYDLDKI
jgi:hypothetical protein